MLSSRTAHLSRACKHPVRFVRDQHSAALAASSLLKSTVCELRFGWMAIIRVLLLLFSRRPLRPLETSHQKLRSFSNPPHIRRNTSPAKWHNTFSELLINSDAASASVIQTILEQSARFGIEPEVFLQQSRLMRSRLGFTADTVIRVFEELPAAFTSSRGIDVCSRVEFLKRDIGISKPAEINRICRAFPQFLEFSVGGRLRPLFDELSDLGFLRGEVRNLLIAHNHNPRFLLGMHPGEPSRCVDLLRGLKCRAPIKERILARGHLSAVVDVKLRIDFLCGRGLIRRDAFKILHVEPRSILYSPDDLEKKVEFLLQRLGFGIDHLVEFPDYLGVNLEKQIAPRLRVVELLRSKGWLGMRVGLKHLVRLSRRRFYLLFVKPYPECEEIFGGLIRDLVVDHEDSAKKKHPNGLWMLFRPQRHPDSQEDVRNMKQFMETLV